MVQIAEDGEVWWAEVMSERGNILFQGVELFRKGMKGKEVGLYISSLQGPKIIHIQSLYGTKTIHIQPLYGAKIIYIP